MTWRPGETAGERASTRSIQQRTDPVHPGPACRCSGRSPQQARATCGRSHRGVPVEPLRGDGSTRLLLITPSIVAKSGGLVVQGARTYRSHVEKSTLTANVWRG